MFAQVARAVRCEFCIEAMNMRALVQTKSLSSPSFKPVQNSLLQRKCACGNGAGLDGMCEDCRDKRLSSPYRSSNANELNRMPLRFGHDFGKMSISPVTHQTVQPKLRINQPSDRYEQEADRMAEMVMRMPDSRVSNVEQPRSWFMLQRKCACGGNAGSESECEECRNKRLQRLAGSGVEPATAPPIVHEVLRSPGQPLDTQTRAFFEPRFGHDFSSVRVHADSKAAKSARDVNAYAYTVGQDIVFGAGQYVPETARCRKVLAHELTHVVQQSGNLVNGKDATHLQRWDFFDDLVEITEFGGEIALSGALQATGLSNVDPEAVGWAALNAVSPGLALAVYARKQFFKDLIASIGESGAHVGEFFKDEVWEAIKAHWFRIMLTTTALLTAEMLVAILAAIPEPTLITKLIAGILQIAIIAILGYFAAVEVKGAQEEGAKWFSIAKKAKGDPKVITEASRSFVRMVWHIVMAIIVLAGVRLRIRNAAVPKSNVPPAGVKPGGTGTTSGGTVTPITSHPRFQSQSASSSTSQPSASAFGPGGTARQLAPADQPAQVTPAVPTPITATAKAPLTPPSKGPGVQPVPATAAGIAWALSEEERRRQDNVYAFGNTTAPRDPRRGTDIKPADIKPDDSDHVGPTDPPTGASSFADVNFAPGMTGHFHGIPKISVPAVDGLQIVPDGSDVGGPHAPTHHTIFPVRRMLFQAFVDKFRSLPWTYAGKKRQ